MKRLTAFRGVFVGELHNDLPWFIDKSRKFRSTIRQNTTPNEIVEQFRLIYNDWREAACTARRVWLGQVWHPLENAGKLRRYLVQFLWKTQGMRRLKKQLGSVAWDEKRLRTWKQVYCRKYPVMMDAARTLEDYVDAYTDLCFSNARCRCVYASPDKMGRNDRMASENRAYPFNHADFEDTLYHGDDNAAAKP